jgi:hypothetical protein
MTGRERWKEAERIIIGSVENGETKLHSEHEDEREKSV